MTVSPSGVDADVTITLAVALKKRTWAVSVHFPGKSTTRAAGVLQTGWTAHSGLAVAMIAAMKSVSKDSLKKIKVDGIPVIRVVTEDAAFATAINQFSAGLKVTGLRSARSLFHPLKKSLNRGRIVTEVLLGADNRILSIRNWGVNVLTPERENGVSLRVFTPLRVKESISPSV